MTAARATPPWIVTLICGASGVGKSSIAIPLARRYGVPLAEADDVVTALKAFTTAEQAPMLHLWDTEPDVQTWTAPRIVQHTVAVAEEIRCGFVAVIADHIASHFDAELSIRAARVGVPVVPARPWSNGVNRVDEALHR